MAGLVNYKKKTNSFQMGISYSESSHVPTSLPQYPRNVDHSYDDDSTEAHSQNYNDSDDLRRPLLFLQRSGKVFNVFECL